MTDVAAETEPQVTEMIRELDTAESMWRRRRNRQNQGQSPDGTTPLSATGSIDELPDVLKRLSYVIEQILTQAPDEVRGSMAFKTVSAMIQEARKDLRRLPEDQVVEFSRMVGNAFLWVADGDYSQVEEMQEAGN